jgi:hypothetical protein
MSDCTVPSILYVVVIFSIILWVFWTSSSARTLIAGGILASLVLISEPCSAKQQRCITGGKQHDGYLMCNDCTTASGIPLTDTDIILDGANVMHAISKFSNAPIMDSGAKFRALHKIVVMINEKFPGNAPPIHIVLKNPNILNPGLIGASSQDILSYRQEIEAEARLNIAEKIGAFITECSMFIKQLHREGLTNIHIHLAIDDRVMFAAEDPHHTHGRDDVLALLLLSKSIESPLGFTKPHRRLITYDLFNEKDVSAMAATPIFEYRYMTSVNPNQKINLGTINPSSYNFRGIISANRSNIHGYRFIRGEYSAAYTSPSLYEQTSRGPRDPSHCIYLSLELYRNYLERLARPIARTSTSITISASPGLIRRASELSGQKRILEPDSESEEEGEMPSKRQRFGSPAESSVSAASTPVMSAPSTPAMPASTPVMSDE